MFENLSHLALQQYWWIIISILGSLLVFLMFVQGGQTLIFSLGKTKTEKTILINSLGRKWEFTFTTLVTFGGAIFASFPLFYACSFGGAYWVWMIILFAFIIQAIAYEFRSKPNNFLGAKTYEIFLLINGSFGTILLGVVIATFFTGSNFIVNDYNLSQWTTPYRGLELVFDFSRYTTFINLSLGIAIFFLARVLGLLYFLNNVNDENIIKRVKEKLIKNAIPFLLFFLFFLINIFLRKGFAVDPETKIVYLESYKYFHNLIQLPLVLILFLLGLLLILWAVIGPVFNITKFSRKSIWFAGFGTIFTVISLFCLAGYNNTSFYPSITNLQSSLTIENASSSHYTLTALSYVSLLIPFVLAYIWYAWRLMNKKQISAEEINDEPHVY